MVGEECLPRIVRAIENDANVVVPSGPRVADKFLQPRLENGRQFIAQPVQRRPERSTPLLVPRMSTGIAAAIAAPAFYAMHTTPGTIIDDLNEVLGGDVFQEFAVIGELGELAAFDFVQGVVSAISPR